MAGLQPCPSFEELDTGWAEGGAGASGPAAGAALKESVAPSDEMVESEEDGGRNTSAAALPASVSELVAAKSALAMAPPARDVLTHAGPRSSNWRSETRRATGVVPKARTCGGAARSSSAQSQRPAEIMENCFARQPDEADSAPRGVPTRGMGIAGSSRGRRATAGSYRGVATLTREMVPRGRPSSLNHIWPGHACRQIMHADRCGEFIC